MNNPKCVKCGSVMMGPRWDAGTDRLKFMCGCGWYKEILPLDSKERRDGTATVR